MPDDTSPAARHTRLRLTAAGACVIVAAAVGGLLAIWSYTAQRQVSAGTVSLSVSPFHKGSLDVYVPVVDWGVRFGGVRAPARLKVELQSVDRDAVAKMVRGGLPATRTVRADARDAVASYLRVLTVLAAAGALAIGFLVLAALRPARSARRALGAGVVAMALGWMLVVALLLAPRGGLRSSQYYAHGGDIPAALQVVENASRAPGSLSEELDGQLLGLARLVNAPGDRPAVGGLPRLTIASDLHNNVVAIAAIRRAAAGGPVVLAGDLTDRGTATEAAAVGDVIRTGTPVVFVAGNHDSDASSRRDARDGAIVLTRRGRLLPGGRHGRLVNRVGGLRMAGYESPNMRHRSDGYADRGAGVTPAEQAAFDAWLLPLLPRVDVVVVHEPALVASAMAMLRADPPSHPVLFVEGHTHHQAVDAEDSVLQINGGTAGAGGTGNLTDGQPIGLAILSYRRFPFVPVAADLVEIAPGTGAGTARRIRLDEGDVHIGKTDRPSPEGPDTTPAETQTAP